MVSGVTTFSQRLKERRKALDLTQEDLADLTGCSIWTIRKIEMGERKPSRQVTELLADALRITGEERTLFIQLARSGLKVDQSKPDQSDPVGHLSQHLHNLPTPPTSLIGREQEMETLPALLLRDNVRLLTLMGPPGIGKTRLALEIGWELLHNFVDGVYFVPLASISDPNLAASTVTGAFGVKEGSGESVQATLIGYLRHKRLLLILDNFEQVISAAGLVADLLSACPELKIIVTSREALHLRGERQVNVSPLALPPVVGAEVSSVEVLAGYAAVQLFVEYAHSVSGFKLTEDNAEAVAAVCTRLDGLPLAIELVAARSRLLPPQAILSRLIGPGTTGPSSLQVATGGARDLPIRHQTLRNAIEWSYNLLDGGERKLFGRLGVFVGSYTLAAVEAVCNATGDLPIDAVCGIESLLDKSLVTHRGHADEGIASDPRLAMLETVREYACEQLTQSGEREQVQRWHAEYYLSLAEAAEAAETELGGPQQTKWLSRLEDDIDNIRAALNWARGANELETMVRLAGAIWHFWSLRGLFSEGRGWLDQALEAVNKYNLSTATRAKILDGSGTLAWLQGDYTRSQTLNEESLSLHQYLGDKLGIAKSLQALGRVAFRQGDYARASTTFEESLALAQQLDNGPMIGYALNNLGLLAQQQGDSSRAVRLLEQYRDIAQELGIKRNIAIASNNLGYVALYTGDYERAGPLLEESLYLFEELGDKVTSTSPRINLGYLALGSKDHVQAASLFRESLILSTEFGVKRQLAECLEGLAGVNVAQGQAEQAAWLLGAAESLREAICDPLRSFEHPQYERTSDKIYAILGDEPFALAWATGRAMSLDRAIACALELPIRS